MIVKTALIVKRIVTIFQPYFYKVCMERQIISA